MKKTGLSYSFGLVSFNANYPSEEIGHGVEPDIVVKPTVHDYMDNKDPVMDRALKCIETDKIGNKPNAPVNGH